MLTHWQSSASTPTERARSKLMSRSYACLQAKKVAYAFTIPQRESLLEEIESFNAKLENVLVANDRISGLTRQTTSAPSKPRLPKALLHFWRHADSMFKLLSQAWTCHCKGLHCARVWLKQRIAATADMKIMLQFCHDTRRHVHLQLAESPTCTSTGTNIATPLRLPLRPISQQFAVPSIRVQSTHAAIKSSSSATTVTVSRTDSRVTWASGQHPQQQQPPLSRSLDLGASDLCETMRASGAKIGECYGGLTDLTSDRYYSVSALESPSGTASTVTLAQVVDGTAAVTFTRIQRYSIAATLASSLLQLESTSWSKGWTADDVHFAHDANAGQGTPLQYDKPFFLAQFTPMAPTIVDRFKSLGTLLLELCFGKMLDEHDLWKQPGFSLAKTNPMMRHFVACEWSKDVDGEAGEQYANAVRFCLHQGPAVLQDD
jgi:hypothetical protein